MVQVLRLGRFKVTIYRETGGRHHRPHCHVYLSDGDSSVSLDNLIVLGGDSLPPLALQLLKDNLELLRSTWDRLNENG